MLVRVNFTLTETYRMYSVYTAVRTQFTIIHVYPIHENCKSLAPAITAPTVISTIVKMVNHVGLSKNKRSIKIETDS